MEAISVPKGFKVTPEQFDRLADVEQLSPMELTQDGELIIMSPTGGEAGEKNFNLYIDLGNWNRQTKLGKAFDSSTIFVLPNGARRSPDVSWIKLDRWNNLTLKEKQGFPPLSPDFASQRVVGVPPIEATDEGAIELVSPSDLKNQKYEDLPDKMTSDPAPTKGGREANPLGQGNARGCRSI